MLMRISYYNGSELRYKGKMLAYHYYIRCFQVRDNTCNITSCRAHHTVGKILRFFFISL